MTDQSASAPEAAAHSSPLLLKDIFGTVTFTGSRWVLMGMLMRGYVLMAMTLGIYRFWLVTAKRRYYWGETALDHDRLEYTGTSIQLLVGFLIAVMFFLPLYVGFFYLSTQVEPALIGIGYGVIAVLIYFLMGYASFRARRFRLTRTLWRGIRFGQSGNPWGYAIRRFLWTLLVIVTLGLAYPFMAASLWRYRFENTWYGDRKFSFSGSWKTVAGPFYVDYLLVALLLGCGAVILMNTGLRRPNEIAATIGVIGLLGVPLLGLIYVNLRSRFTSRFYSSVSVGEARLKVRVRARSILWMYVLYAIMLIVATIIVGVLAAIIAALFFDGATPDLKDMAEVARMGWVNLLIFGGFYLFALGLYSAVSEAFLGMSWWRLLARGASIENIEDLASVRAQGDESPITGEGIADALNVGAY